MAGTTPLKEMVILGPFHLFDNSFILEFLQSDPSRNASFLIRSTFRHAHPLTKTSKSHPFTPPLHLHFDFAENFEVLSGTMGSTLDYESQNQIWTAADGPQVIPAMAPHTFWPTGDGEEDTTVLLWHRWDRGGTEYDMPFFLNVLQYTSDAYEKKRALNPLQLILMQHVTKTAFVWFPTMTWLGSLRWWIPWKIQTAVSAIAVQMAYLPLLEEYTPEKDWQALMKSKTM